MWEERETILFVELRYTAHGTYNGGCIGTMCAICIYLLIIFMTEIEGYYYHSYM